MIGCFATAPAQAQNLEAGKSPAQLFASACAICHNTTRNLVRTVSPRSLPNFLRQHYTTSSTMAANLSTYLLAHGAVARDREEGRGHGRRQAGPHHHRRHQSRHHSAGPASAAADKP